MHIFYKCFDVFSCWRLVNLFDNASLTKWCLLTDITYSEQWTTMILHLHRLTLCALACYCCFNHLFNKFLEKNFIANFEGWIFLHTLLVLPSPLYVCINILNKIIFSNANIIYWLLYIVWIFMLKSELYGWRMLFSSFNRSEFTRLM